MQSDLSKRGLIKQVSGLDDETIDRLGGVTESGLPDHPERDETRPIDTDRPESSRTGRDSGFRAYRYAGVLGIEPCGCGDRECMDGKVVDITNDVREMENRLARHEGQTNAIT